MHSLTLLFRQNGKRWLTHIGALLLTLAFLFAGWLPMLAMTKIDIVGPSGSAIFGASVAILSNGNLVVTDPFYDLPNGNTDVGAVYLYDGTTRALISTLTGSANGDEVGSGGIVELTNGNFVIVSLKWHNNGAANSGAVSWGSATTGISGVVNSGNSLIGSHSGDQIGSGGIVTLSNGNYLVISPNFANGNVSGAGAVTWGNGTSGVNGAVSNSNSLTADLPDVQVGSGGVIALSNGNYLVHTPKWKNNQFSNLGAVTWGNGATGVRGLVNSGNSLVGSKEGDKIGSEGVTALSNGNYVISSAYWDNGSVEDAGAATWADGTTGVQGTISSANSLVGITEWDRVALGGVVELSNGNYVVISSLWRNTSAGAGDAGAVTWGNGTSGIVGQVSTSNSLVGIKGSDGVSSGGVAALSNGNYVVISDLWQLIPSKRVGAVTWVDGSQSFSGEVTADNSLIGSSFNDSIGSQGVVALTNGNYVVVSSSWDNGDLDVGAVTWGNGASGTIGVVGSSNSLVGSVSSDNIGSGGVIPLSNGNYVVVSPNWNNNNTIDAGAVTWVNGAFSSSGVVGSNNSLVGTTENDKVGGGGVIALTNGNYVVRSQNWDNGNIVDAGAVTWGSGASATNSVPNSTNSLVGGKNGDRIGLSGVVPLSNGNYVVSSPFWDTDTLADAGAMTWANGASGIHGLVTSANSLVGSAGGDYVGHSPAIPLSNGDYVVHNAFWDNGNIANGGAVTWAIGNTAMFGAINGERSVFGTAIGGGISLSYDMDVTRQQLAVGRPGDNIVTIFGSTVAEINVSGKGAAIADGDSSPVGSDGTDLGAKVVGSGSVAQSFTISNTGDGALTINSISFSGANAGDFSISNFSAPKVVAPNGAISFDVNFAPTAVGLRTATLNIANNDSNENPYNFVVQGTGVQHTLTTATAGNGTGSITLSPAGGHYNHNTVVTVTAKADAGSTFAGWNGDCSGTGSCSVTMTSAKSVTATFSKSGNANSQKVYLPLVTK